VGGFNRSRRPTAWRPVAVAGALVAGLLPVITGTIDAPLAPAASAGADVPGGLGFFPITPCRASDTRSPAAGGRLLPGTTRDLQIGGTGPQFTLQGGAASGCEVPDGVGAVEVSVTAAGPSGAGFIRAYPNGSTAPDATVVNYSDGRGATNTVTVPLAASGTLDLEVANFGGSTDVIVDVQGYFAASGGQGFVPLSAPCRIADTRATGGQIASGSSRTFLVDGSTGDFVGQGGTDGGCGVPDGTTAVEFSVTAVDPTGTGFLRVTPNSSSVPNAAFVNYTPNANTTNTGTVRLEPLQTKPLRVANQGTPVHVIVDVQGYYTSTSAGRRYQTITPCRTVDTRNAGGRLPGGASRAFQTGGRLSGFAAQGARSPIGCGVPQRATAVEASFTAIDPVGTGFLRVFPNGRGTPNATFLNYSGGRGTTNSGTVPLAGLGLQDLAVTNLGGASHLAVDVLGYYEPASAANNGAEQVTSSGATCALLVDRTLRCWGNNFSGEVGDGTDVSRAAPVTVVDSDGTGALPGVVDVASGTSSTCAVLASGLVKCWGSDGFGALGNGPDAGSSLRPAQVLNGTQPLGGATQVSVGFEHACALLQNGTVRCWGRNQNGQVGDGTTSTRNTATVVVDEAGTGALSGVVQISASLDSTCATKADGTARCWGANESGQLGDGTASGPSTRPVTVRNGDTTPLAPIVQVASIGTTSCALLADTTVRCWGANNRSQLGNGGTTPSPTPVTVLATSGSTPLSGVLSLTGGTSTVCTIVVGGGARCWGSNDGGQLGINSTTSTTRPVAAQRSNFSILSPVTGLAGVATGGGVSCAVGADVDPGTLSIGDRTLCWGTSLFGGLGSGVLSDQKLTASVVTGIP